MRKDIALVGAVIAFGFSINVEPVWPKIILLCFQLLFLFIIVKRD